MRVYNNSAPDSRRACGRFEASSSKCLPFDCLKKHSSWQQNAPIALVTQCWLVFLVKQVRHVHKISLDLRKDCHLLMMIKSPDACT